MRKILAIILAVAMLATLIPSAFATETTNDGSAYDGVEITYDLQNLVNGVNYTAAKGTKFKDILNYNSTNGLFKYVRSSKTDTAQALNVVGDEITGTTSTANVMFAGGVGTGYVRLWNAHYVCFEIVVPESGDYTLKTTYLTAKNGAQNVNIHLTPASEFYALSSLSTAKIRDEKVLGEAIGSFDCLTGATDSSFTAGRTRGEAEFEKTISAGRYIITFQAVGGQGSVGTFTLTSGTNPEHITNGGASVKYNLSKALVDNNFGWTSRPAYSIIDYDETNGFYCVVHSSEDEYTANRNIGVAGTDPKYLRMKDGRFICFEIKVPEAGKYALKVDYQERESIGDVNVYVTDKETYDKQSSFAIANLGNVGKYSYNCAGSEWVSFKIIGENLDLSAGEYVITFHAKGGEGTISSFELVNGPLGTLTIDMGALIKISNTALTVGETAEIVGAAAYLSDGSVDESKTASGVYESSDSSVVAVSGTTLTAIGAGTAEIMTTVGDEAVSRTVTVSDIAAPGTVTLATSDNISNEIAINGSDYVRGDEVTVTAEDKSADGYTFRHWVRGTEANGEWVSSDEEYTFNLITNTFLTAIYTKNATTDEKTVEFWNGNGEYITQKNVVDGKVELPENPELTGVGFLRWIVAENTAFVNENITAPLTRAVAEYESLGKTITVEGEVVEYDEEITKNSESGNEVAWYRDGVLVGFGKSYTYNAWANVNSITEAPVEKKAPVVVLDKAVKGTARMIEYDAGNMNIVEVGILFGDTSAKPTVDSCKYKATSAKSGVGIHGQFTAKPADSTYTNARGYLIYKDGSTYKVIYAD